MSVSLMIDHVQKLGVEESIERPYRVQLNMWSKRCMDYDAGDHVTAKDLAKRLVAIAARAIRSLHRAKKAERMDAQLVQEKKAAVLALKQQCDRDVQDAWKLKGAKVGRTSSCRSFAKVVVWVSGEAGGREEDWDRSSGGSRRTQPTTKAHARPQPQLRARLPAL
jgi:hypothetical protein